jgi:hypothetical protein
VDTETGNALFSVSNLQIPDYFTVMNGIVGGGPEPDAATVSFTVEWGGGGERNSWRNTEQMWDGDFIANTATLSWTAENANGFSFTADPYDVGFAQVGAMRNGSFFN